jgi:hypothetical protein
MQQRCKDDDYLYKRNMVALKFKKIIKTVKEMLIHKQPY